MARLLIAALLLASAAVFVTSAPVQAGTIVIEPGSASGPNIFGDETIRNALDTGHFTLDTSDITQSDAGGPDEIHIEAGVVITWTSQYSLTLLAGADVLITGTVQHDGPGNGPNAGAGGIRIDAGGDVQLGDGTQSVAIGVGSRHGVTEIDAQNVRLRAADSGSNRFSQIGYFGPHNTSPFSTTGSISVTAVNSVTAIAGGGNYAYVQVGNGGYQADGDHSGNHTLYSAMGDVLFQGGENVYTYAQAGNGGFEADGNQEGNHTIQAPNGSVDLRGGPRQYTYVQVGNGGHSADGDKTGDQHIYAQNVTVQGGGGLQAYAQVGNGGYDGDPAFDGVLSGSMTISATQAVTVAGQSLYAYALVGNGGYRATGDKTGDHTVRSGTGDILFQAGGVSYAFAQVGNGGYEASGGASGNHIVATQAGDVIFRGGVGNYTYVLLGNGGNIADGEKIGDHTVHSVTGDILFLAGEGDQAFAQLGNGGYDTHESEHSGNHSVRAENGDVTFHGGGGQRTYAQVGNGGIFSDGDQTGNHEVYAQNIFFQGGNSSWNYAQVGNGGRNTSGTLTGTMTISATQVISFAGGTGEDAYVQVGNGGGGPFANGNHSGNHGVYAQTVTFQGGSGERTYAQVGNGGALTDGNHSGGHRVSAANGDVYFQGGEAPYAYAQVGNGGYDAPGDHSGNHTVEAPDGDVFLLGGDGNWTYAQIGNGGFLTEGDHSGSHEIYAQNVTLQGGDNSIAWTHLGNGGFRYSAETGELSGSMTISATQAVTVAGGLNSSGYGLVGNGGYNADGNKTGDHTVRSGTGDILFQGGNNLGWVMLGNGGYDAGGTHSGSHTVATQAGDVIFRGGDIGSWSYALLGNGGNEFGGVQSGDHHVSSISGDILFEAGDAFSAFAQVGNGGYEISGNHNGSHTVQTQSGNIEFRGGNGQVSYAQVGNGGDSGTGNFSGSHRVATQDGDILFEGGGNDWTYAQVGNGGTFAEGSHSGDHSVDSANGSIMFQAGSGSDAYAQVGNGGYSAYGSGHSGDHSVRAENGDISFEGGSVRRTYAQVGNGGTFADGDHSGNHGVYAQNVTFQAGSGEYAAAQVGNGGYSMNGVLTGTVTISATQVISFAGGTGEGAYAQIGHGGYYSTGDQAGDILIYASDSFSMRAGSHALAYAQIGHGTAIEGSPFNLYHLGERRGDILLAVGQDITLEGARMGHYTFDGVESVLEANTTLVAGGNDPYPSGSGSIHASHTPTFTTIFNSAPVTNSGELRFYAPRKSNVDIAAATPMNGESYPGTVPDNRTVGFFLFPDGGYIDEYSFYFGLPSDLAVVKSVTPTGTLLPNQPITYTLAFSNSGLITATQTVLTDTLVAPIYNLVIEETVDPGVILTPTGSAPNLVWEIGDLAPGTGGEITISGRVTTTLSAPLGWFNTAGITGTGEVTFTNNVIAVASNATPPIVTLAPTATTVLESDGTAGLSIVLNIANPWLATVVNYATSDDTAIGGSDYVAQSAAATVPAGQTSVAIGVPILNDAVEESDERFSVNLTGSPSAALGSAISAVVTILDDDSALSVTAVDADKAEGDSGSTPFVFEVARTGYLTAPVTVDYAVSSAQADAADFVGNVLPTGTVTLAAGQASAQLVVNVQGDVLAEADEVFTVTLSNPSANAQIVTGTATGTIRNDDAGPVLAVEKSASVNLARVGETITYTVRITNTGTVDVVNLNAVDDPLGPITLDRSSLAVGEVALGQQVYTVQQSDLPGPLVNTVTVTGTSIAGDVAQSQAVATVELVDVAFTFTKTVGIVGIQPECTANATMQVPISTTVVYCFTVTNTGAETLNTHTLVDSQLGTVLDNVVYDLVPGASFSTTVTRTLYASVTNTAQWQADYASATVAGAPDNVMAAGIDAAPVVADATATVIISSDTDDQDGDGIPDNVEGADDVDGDNVPNFLDLDSDGDGRPDAEECPTLPCRDSNNNGIPDFLDPTPPTNLPPGEQPNQIGEERLFLPRVNRE